MNPLNRRKTISGAAWIAGQARNDSVSAVIPDSIRDPLHFGHIVSGAAWIADRARNDKA